MSPFLLNQKQQHSGVASPETMQGLTARLDQVLEHLRFLEERLTALSEARVAKEWYSTDEVAGLLGKRPFTVREWCRLGRIKAEKRACGRGHSQEWMIAHQELARVRSEGLLPQPRPEY
jgi:hypothetical protein